MSVPQMALRYFYRKPKYRTAQIVSIIGFRWWNPCTGDSNIRKDIKMHSCHHLLPPHFWKQALDSAQFSIHSSLWFSNSPCPDHYDCITCNIQTVAIYKDKEHTISWNFQLLKQNKNAVWTASYQDCSSLAHNKILYHKTKQPMWKFNKYAPQSLFPIREITFIPNHVCI